MAALALTQAQAEAQAEIQASNLSGFRLEETEPILVDGLPLPSRPSARAELVQAEGPSEEQTAAILDGISEAIQGSSLVDLEFYLEQLEIPRDIGQKDFQAMFLAFLTLCQPAENKEIVQAVVRKFQENNLNELRFRPILIDVWTWDESTDDNLRLLARAFPVELQYPFVVDQLSDYPDGYEMYRTLERLERIFGQQTLGTYKGLFLNSRDKGSSRITEFLEPKIIALDVPVERPTWVRNFAEGPVAAEYEIPEPRPPKFNLPAPEEAAEMYLQSSGLYAQIPATAASRAIIAKMYAEGDEQRKLEILADPYRVSYMQSFDDDPTYFRLLGPRQAMSRLQSDDYQHPCVKYGGCNMLVCNHAVDLEDDEEIDMQEAPVDWYVGYCEYRGCLRKIPYRVWCVREPLGRGSWGKSFHSFDCMLSDMKERTGRKTVTAKDLEAVSDLQSDLLEVGIQDRTSNNPILPWPSPPGELHPGETPMRELLPPTRVAEII